jgi:hypothetical protein
MPEGKRGQRSAGRPGKGNSRTAAKPAPAKRAKRPVSAAAAKPVAKRRAAKPDVKIKIKPAAKRKVAKVAAKPTAKRKVTETRVKPKESLKVDLAAMAEVKQQAVAEIVAEPWSITPEFESLSSQWSTDASIEPVVDVLVGTPVDGWGTHIESEPAADFGATYSAVDSVAEHMAAEAAPEAQHNNADTLFKPFVERRMTIKSLLERRLADPSAKERRVAASLARECEAAAAANAPAIAAAAKERKVKIAAAAKESAANPATPPFVERRAADRRSGWGVETDMRVRAQQNLFNETALWMRKGGVALIALNVLLVLAVLFLWHSHSTQAPAMTEIQKAMMTEMRRATAASEVAAYASCLGSQTARSMMLQMKGPSTRVLQVGNELQATTTTLAQAAQIEFDVEKNTSVSVHVPVLFHLGIQNIGKSSALNTKVWGAVKVLDSGKEPDFRYSDVALSKATIAPSDPAAKVVLYSADDAGLVVPVNDAMMQRVKSGDAYVVAYGKVVYEDIFGTRHWAVFCHNITEPAGAAKNSNKCMAYNSTGVSDTPSRPLRMPAPQNASMTLPEIACELPKHEKN